MSTMAYALPRSVTGGPRSSRGGGARTAHGWGEGWRDVLQEACPLVMAPSPVREALTAA